MTPISNRVYHFIGSYQRENAKMPPCIELSDWEHAKLVEELTQRSGDARTVLAKTFCGIPIKITD